MENHITVNYMEEIKMFNCCHSTYYKNQEVFKFLPGHASTVGALPKYVEKYRIAQQPEFELNGRYSPILEELIKTADLNLFKDKHHATYSDTLRWFATYIFLLCGRSCYEVLCANLPLPSTKTICE